MPLAYVLWDFECVVCVRQSELDRKVAIIDRLQVSFPRSNKPVSNANMFHHHIALMARPRFASFGVSATMRKYPKPGSKSYIFVGKQQSVVRVAAVATGFAFHLMWHTTFGVTHAIPIDRDCAELDDADMKSTSLCVRANALVAYCCDKYSARRMHQYQLYLFRQIIIFESKTLFGSEFWGEHI